MMNQLLMSVLSQRKSVPAPPEFPSNVVCFVSGSSRTITPKYTNSGVILQYSIDSGATWTNISSGSATTSAKVHWFRGRATGTKSLFTSENTTNAWEFSGSSDLAVYGNLNFLLCNSLGATSAPTSLEICCYARMFYNCTSLTVAPALPATTLGNYCYYQMFYGCTSLTTAPPALPAYTVGTYCYFAMFRGCTSLTTAPSLSATTLGTNYCCYQMFHSCTSLTTAPSLPATSLRSNCYSAMFSGCTSLTTAPSLPATSLAPDCYSSMFYGCRALTTAPNLPATTLATDCYYAMFDYCPSLKVSSTKTGAYIYNWRIPTSGSASTVTGWNTNMLRSTGGTFTSNPNINTTYYVQNQPV